MTAAKILCFIAHAAVNFGGWLWHFLNTNFSAALFGALGGAFAAHYVATRSEERKRLRNEIAGVNASVALANVITNVFVSMKRQHIRGMAEIYKRGFERYIAVLTNPPNKPTVFEFISDFRELDVPFTPIAELRQNLLDRVLTYGPGLSVTMVLQQSIASFANLIEARHRSIARMKSIGDDQERARIYFGVRTSDGHIDERFADQITGLQVMTDNCIYFSMLLCEILSAHGEKIKKQLGRGAPNISKITYGPFEEGLLPDPRDFPDFEKQFRPKVETKK
jgi:hypothetical protein